MVNAVCIKEKKGGFRMKVLAKYLFVLTIFFIMMGFNLQSHAQTKGSPPVINFAWAQETIRQGNDWRIYISATDPDGDMARIYCRVNQVGGDIYRPDITRIKKEMEGKLTGYLVLRTYSSQDFSGLSLTLTVIIEDREKNESKPIVFPLRFNGEGVKSPPADRVSPDLAKELNQRIGHIGIDLLRRDQMGAGD
jgi:hypothetical protein